MESKNGNGPADPKSKKPKFQFNFYWIYIVVAVVFLGFQFLSLTDGPKEINWKKFSNEMLANHDVDHIVVVNKETAEIFLKKRPFILLPTMMNKVS